MTHINPEPMTQDNAALVLVDRRVGLMTGIPDYPVGIALACRAFGVSESCYR